MSHTRLDIPIQSINSLYSKIQDDVLNMPCDVCTCSTFNLHIVCWCTAVFLCDFVTTIFTIFLFGMQQHVLQPTSHTHAHTLPNSQCLSARCKQTRELVLKPVRPTPCIIRCGWLVELSLFLNCRFVCFFSLIKIKVLIEIFICCSCWQWCQSWSVRAWLFWCWGGNTCWSPPDHGSDTTWS